MTPAPRTQYFAAISIDGFLADERDGLDWLLQFGFDEFQARYDAFITDVGALIMGARTYEFILAEGDAAWSYGDMPCWVLTHRTDLAVPAGANVTFLAGDARDAHAAALEAAGGRHVWIVGGGDVAAQLARHGCIDDLVVTIMPVLLGTGKRLHPDVAVTTPLRLTGTHEFPSGAIELSYEFAPSDRSR